MLSKQGIPLFCLFHLKQNNRIAALFLLWFLIMLLLIILTEPEERPDKLEIISFSTTQSSEIFFSNVRSIYYHKKTEAEGTMDAYRLNSWNKDSIAPSLNFTVYAVWDANKAFIRLDTHNLIYDNYDVVYLLDSEDNYTDTIALPDAYNDSQYVFAKHIYRALEAEKTIILSSEEKQKSIAPHSNDAKSIKMILKDYFRLIGKI